MRARDDKPAGDERPRRSAYDKALALLARREQSRRELRTKLTRDGYASDEIDDAMQRLGEAHYQDDARFAEMLVRSRIRQGYGPQRLRAELRTHDLPDDLIAAQLAEADADWLVRAREQLHRRYGDSAPQDYRERAKRMQFLVRRGFDPATAHAATE